MSNVSVQLVTLFNGEPAEIKPKFPNIPLRPLRPPHYPYQARKGIQQQRWCSQAGRTAAGNRLLHITESYISANSLERLRLETGCTKQSTRFPHELYNSHIQKQKMSQTLKGIYHQHLREVEKLKQVQRCEDCLTILDKSVGIKKVCDLCTVRNIMIRKQAWLRRLLGSISDGIDDLKGCRRSSRRYIKKLQRYKKSKNSVIMHYVNSGNPQLHSPWADVKAAIQSRLVDKIKYLPDTKKTRSKSQQMWAKVYRHIDKKKEAVKSLFPANKLWEVVLTAMEKERRVRKMWNSALTNLVGKRATNTDPHSLSNLSPLRARISFRSFLRKLPVSGPKTKKINPGGRTVLKLYLTTEDATDDVSQMIGCFKSWSKPGIHVRPQALWQKLQERNLLDNLKPFLTVLQVNRLTSPFDHFLGEDWLYNYKRHNNLERQRVRCAFNQVEEFSKIQKIRKFQTLPPLHKAKNKLATVEGIWKEFGISAQVQASKHKLAELLQRTSASNMKAKVAEDKRIQNAQIRGRRFGLTDSDREPIMRVRKAASHTKSRTLRKVKKPSENLEEVKKPSDSQTVEIKSSSSFTELETVSSDTRTELPKKAKSQAPISRKKTKPKQKSDTISTVRVLRSSKTL